MIVYYRGFFFQNTILYDYSILKHIESIIVYPIIKSLYYDSLGMEWILHIDFVAPVQLETLPLVSVQKWGTRHSSAPSCVSPVMRWLVWHVFFLPVRVSMICHLSLCSLIYVTILMWLLSVYIIHIICIYEWYVDVCTLLYAYVYAYICIYTSL